MGKRTSTRKQNSHFTSALSGTHSLGRGFSQEGREGGKEGGREREGEGIGHTHRT